jgi:hypothetical protein
MRRRQAHLPDSYTSTHPAPTEAVLPPICISPLSLENPSQTPLLHADVMTPHSPPIIAGRLGAGRGPFHGSLGAWKWWDGRGTGGLMGMTGRMTVLMVCSYGRDVVVTDGKGKREYKRTHCCECVGRGRGMRMRGQSYLVYHATSIPTSHLDVYPLDNIVRVLKSATKCPTHSPNGLTRSFRLLPKGTKNHTFQPFPRPDPVSSLPRRLVRISPCLLQLPHPTAPSSKSSPSKSDTRFSRKHLVTTPCTCISATTSPKSPSPSGNRTQNTHTPISGRCRPDHNRNQSSASRRRRRGSGGAAYVIAPRHGRYRNGRRALGWRDHATTGATRPFTQPGVNSGLGRRLGSAFLA